MDINRVRCNLWLVLARRLTWISLAALAISCFGPWASATTFQNEPLTLGAMNEYMSGAPYLLVLVAGATFGLLARLPALTTTCAVLAVLLAVWMAAEAPDTMLQFGYEAHLVWGGYLVVVSSVAFALSHWLGHRARRRTGVTLKLTAV